MIMRNSKIYIIGVHIVYISQYQVWSLALKKMNLEVNKTKTKNNQRKEKIERKKRERKGLGGWVGAGGGGRKNERNYECTR